MFLKRVSFRICLLAFSCMPLFAQTHTAVPLDDRVYYILEQAELRGLSGPLSGRRPYSRDVVVKAINEILGSGNSGRLTASERDILRRYLDGFAVPKPGLDMGRGSFYAESELGPNEIPVTAEIRVGADFEGSGGFYFPEGREYLGLELWVRAQVNGDVGRHLSYGFSAEGGLMRLPRKRLGTYNTYYEGFVDNGEFQNRVIDVYSEPLSHFPFSHRKRWDGSIYFFDNLSVFSSWPDDFAGAYNLNSELSLSFLENKLTARLARLPREWGSVPLGSSMALNGAARPFLALEAEFNPFPWFGIASMTGVLEYHNAEGIKKSAMNFQNAYSITMLQFRYKNYFFLDLGEMVVWPKRFEIGYLSPITNSIFYQNNIGDFDNMAAMVNLKTRRPGFGSVWASLFWDEAWWVSNFAELDRTMIAVQAGWEIGLPILSFSSLTFSYTKINPYTYTHNRNFNPWYGDNTMETSYTNNGVSLGHYLPPNSDEFLLRFKTMPAKSLVMNFQYQLIRHGAHYGSSAVDGSHLLSELDPEKRDGSNPVLKRFFLRDGAYRWMHLLRLGGEWSLPGIPVALFGEMGVNITYFTNTFDRSGATAPANSGSPRDFRIIDTAEYPRSTGVMAKIGIRIFP
ncbi:MAG: hypothetical protein FWD94_01030 [Treponema sp.]|nr:hypothetical protein [Treponema sp.]